MRSGYLSEHCIVYVLMNVPGYIGFSSPGDESWTYAMIGNNSINLLLSDEGCRLLMCASSFMNDEENLTKKINYRGIRISTGVLNF